MNVDGKRSVNSILSSFCSEVDEANSCHVSSVKQLNNNSAEVVLDNNLNHFTVSKILVNRYSVRKNIASNSMY